MTATDARLATRRLPEGVTATAVWGQTKRQDGAWMHRHLLTWTHPERTGPLNLVIGMNPSGASETEADATLIKVWGFCERWNRGPFTMANVVAYRATEPGQMRFHGDEEDRNLSHVLAAAQRARASGGKVIVAWGAPSIPRELKTQFAFNALRLWTHLHGADIPVLCLGRTADGSPRHPLMLAYETPLETWSPR